MYELWNAYWRAAQAGWEANAVIALRLMRLAAGGALAQREAQRMMTEKVAAGLAAQTAAATALIAGRGPGRAAKAAERVYRRKVKANRRRLTRRRKRS